MEDSINYLKEKMKIDEDFGEKPLIKDLKDRTKMQSARSYGREYSKGEWHQSAIVFSTAKERRASQSRLPQRRDKSRLPCIFL